MHRLASILLSEGLMGLFLIICVAFTFNKNAVASENEKIIFSEAQSGYSDNLLPQGQYKYTISGEEIFKRTQAVLNYFHVPNEAQIQDDFTDLKNIRNFLEIQQIINWMDPLNFFKRLSIITQTNISVFQDFDSKNVLDVSLNLGSKSAHLNTEISLGLPLKGIRIALDPGHMGGSKGDHFWDNQTGKFVHDKQGHILSEGVLNLQTCILLKIELEKLGATVFLTRDDLRPVSHIEYATFDIKPYALGELRDSIHTDWFQKLISSSASDKVIFKNFENSSEVKKIFSEKYKSEYFIKREDLWVRSALIDSFQPDIILIIHYDTADPAGDSSALNPRAPLQTKAFVVGGYEKTEFASSESKKYFVRHLLDKNSWDESIKLSRNITSQLHFKLNLDLAKSAGDGSTQIEPGIFSRNLIVPRRIKTSAVTAYLECLFYNRPDEFKLLSQANHSMMIAGQDVPYSDRLVKVVAAIKAGVISYVQSK